MWPGVPTRQRGWGGLNVGSPDGRAGGAGTCEVLQPDKGWGGIESDEASGEVWIHWAAIDIELARVTVHRSIVGGRILPFNGRGRPTARDGQAHSLGIGRRNL
jgi:hypothetical protein